MKVGFCTKIQTASVIQTKKEQRGVIAKSNTGQKRSGGGLASGRAAVYEKSSMSQEMLENMEIVDPHMSEEELEELKRKHRAAENKAIVKAEMDYLKGLSGGGGAEVCMEAAAGEGIDIQV